MNYRNTLFLLVLVLCLFSCSPAQALQVQFVRILDGDSMIVESGGDAVEIRLIGVDAPEYKQEYSNKAKVFSLKFCHRKKLRLEFDKDRKDRYGRTLAYVWVGDRMLNEEIVKAGLAIAIKVKPNTRHYYRLKSAETEAKKEKRGFWLRGGLKQTPAQWRHSRK